VASKQFQAPAIAIENCDALQIAFARLQAAFELTGSARKLHIYLRARKRRGTGE
jgi:hypothetical protein